ncbi:cytochrome o ubiquinol oxidase subunit III [Ralstonia pseudosolanacearum]|uniref:cytochrome o ubiquinol oxidase subunit III n=1 Tax=Ralstonia pseudosolanacearum TaxID=1310165 RepID=UPI0026769EE7|nr:cytochrome o ubiquinol oxidase subunit III [Ralstonia pseudosolanacearum]MDO3527658.1 cytochrome o ubiquinol oxidase subunit III [Ralstonia pseudosolanacearum]MDO3532406.1 cytochrome o ubiquinol oxidase subunit III [Ralstonia pseudosolanacearum]MDO3563257.1 cytochrome o ubiquinol oxidase subunit III [Ralstonia pseudosolanacearum]MDO3572834.1 cytochrome o ubiquinol oxidase subunit III [Ralstonia pseudosolanacearum]MDO3618263.1 cytochrome o ubiquinol oxidase subunit III [Ralstonia pseudosolan
MTPPLSPTLDPTAPEAAHPHPHHDTGFNTTLGFWLYLMSDCLIFAVLFATFGVLSGSTAGGPGGRQLFELPFVFAETMLLLVSSYTFGIALLKQDADAAPRMVRWLGVTFLLGALFVGMELYEFSHLLHEGAGPGVSAYLSAVFTLVGTHGLHVTAGLLWLAVMMHQVRHFGLDGVVRRRLACLSLFWHFLDLVWICVFTFVYLREFA